MKEQHTHARSPLEAALWEFKYQEKQWLAEKAGLRRDAEAQRKQTARLQHQLDRLQVRQLTDSGSYGQRSGEDRVLQHVPALSTTLGAPLDTS